VRAIFGVVLRILGISALIAGGLAVGAAVLIAVILIGPLIFWVAWNVLNFRAFPALASARQQVDVSRLTETQQRRQLLLSVAATYYSGVSLRELAQVASQSQVDQDLAKMKAELGTGSEGEKKELEQ